MSIGLRCQLFFLEIQPVNTFLDYTHLFMMMYMFIVYSYGYTMYRAIYTISIKLWG